jgi:hypothetical protein
MGIRKKIRQIYLNFNISLTGNCCNYLMFLLTRGTLTTTGDAGKLMEKPVSSQAIF